MISVRKLFKLCVILAGLVVGVLQPNLPMCWDKPESASAQSVISGPESVANTSHQLTVPAGPYSVVNTGTGQMVTMIPIVGWESRGDLSVAFALTQVSNDTTDWPGIPAPGWRHSYNSWIASATALVPQIYQWNSPSSFSKWTKNTGSSTFDRKWRNPNDLQTLGSDGFQVTTQDAKIHYDFTRPWLGYRMLTSISDLHNNQLEVHYLSAPEHSPYVDYVLDKSSLPNVYSRKLELVYEDHYSQYYQAFKKVLKEIRAIDSAGTQRTYTITYCTQWGLEWCIQRIQFPSPGDGSEVNYVEFEYLDASRIKKISMPSHRDGSELEWTYTYDSARRVIEVSGPTADDGNSTTTSFSYGYNATERIQQPSLTNKYQRCIVRNPKYTGNRLEVGDTNKYNREVHLYYCNPDSDPTSKEFGALIKYLIGSASSVDSTGGQPNADAGSKYDTEVHKAYPGCYFSEYEWDMPATKNPPLGGVLFSYTDPRGQTWGFGWDDRGNLTYQGTPTGRGTTGYHYSDYPRLLESVTKGPELDPARHIYTSITSYTYNGTHDLYTETDGYSLGLTTTYTYDSYGNDEIVTDPYGQRTQSTYDDAYHCYPVKVKNLETNIFSLSSIKTTAEGVTPAHYDMFGLVQWSDASRKEITTQGGGTQILGQTLKTTFHYDDIGRLKTIDNPDGTHSEKTYNVRNSATYAKDADNNTSEFSYDNYGHIVETREYPNPGGLALSTRLHYNSLGQKINTQWDNGNVQTISYTYDERGRLIQETFPGDGTPNGKPGNYKYTYDGAGKVVCRDDRNGSTILRSYITNYYDDGRIWTQTYKPSSGASVVQSHSYYRDDGLLVEKSGSDGTVSYTYDSATRLLTSKESNVGKTVTYDYGSPSNHKDTVSVDGQSFIFNYNIGSVSDGNLHTVTSPYGPVTQYLYDGNPYGLLSRLNYNSSVVGAPHITYEYDDTDKKRLWLNKMTHFRSDNSVISSYTYIRDAVGNRTSIIEGNGVDNNDNKTTNYTYDGIYRLKTETINKPANNPIYSFVYQYDNAGNRIQKQIGSTVYNYAIDPNSFNLLFSASGGPNGLVTFEYDDYGRLQTKKVGSGSSEVWTYEYNFDDDLIAVKLNGVNKATFGYDILGRRIWKAGADGDKHYFVYNGSSVIAETEANKNIIAWYTSGICETRMNASGAWETYYYQSNDLGSTQQLTDSMQRVANAYMYNAWGEELADVTATRNTGVIAPINPYKYVGSSGCYTDDETGLIQMGARYYDPMLGRFITQDPLGDGLNWYAYCDNNPVNETDPSGQIGGGASVNASLSIGGAIETLFGVDLSGTVLDNFGFTLNAGMVNAHNPDEGGVDTCAFFYTIGLSAGSDTTGLSITQNTYPNMKDVNDLEQGASKGLDLSLNVNKRKNTPMPTKTQKKKSSKKTTKRVGKKIGKGGEVKGPLGLGPVFSFDGDGNVSVGVGIAGTGVAGSKSRTHIVGRQTTSVPIIHTKFNVKALEKSGLMNYMSHPENFYNKK